MINHLDKKIYLRKTAWWWNFPSTMIVTGLVSHCLAPQKRMCRDSNFIFELGFIQRANDLRRQHVNIIRIAIYLISSENVHIRSRCVGWGKRESKVANHYGRQPCSSGQMISQISQIHESCFSSYHPLNSSLCGYLASSTGLKADLLSVFQYQPCIDKEDQAWGSTLIQHKQTMNSFIVCSYKFFIQYEVWICLQSRRHKGPRIYSSCPLSCTETMGLI